MTPLRNLTNQKPDKSTSPQQELRVIQRRGPLLYQPCAAESPPIYVAGDPRPTTELQLGKWTEVFSSQPYKCYCQGRRKEEAALQPSGRNKTRAYGTKPRGRSMQRNPPRNTSQQVLERERTLIEQINGNGVNKKPRAYAANTPFPI